MHVTYLLVVLFPLATAAPHNSPVYVQIQTDTSKSFDVGPYDRTRFDLVEQFHPLQTASVATGEHLQELRRRVAAGVKSVQPTEPTEESAAIDTAVHDGSTDESAEVPSLLREYPGIYKPEEETDRISKRCENWSPKAERLCERWGAQDL
ncbi:hypothetical protein Y032_0393g605 [Ancylostoma ceylanicum]|uniref:Uncharacterized protein n=1 Tax=Ancylostoma ceylanicum TaxID=53326 RepID=A0A016RRS3_9BILA|nr:hypothetical protein Y032_0393g605 [Ancylostoma ceylanicum]